MTHLSEREQTSLASFLRPGKNEGAQTDESPGTLLQGLGDLCPVDPKLQLNYWFRLIPNW